ncbi:hypothetical protein TNCV_5107071 [Trichonephila clavipes]|uniref:Uncharacterized protein n=1 Tax=Trichonephila clavipes TaxID=2585209 RepID=A0A8X6RKP7_TRICX|nr:hypothetical protein TNCV_5107071 [Trichonephila clavipes]
MLGKIPDISLIAEKEFRSWVAKDLDPFSNDRKAILNPRRIKVDSEPEKLYVRESIWRSLLLKNCDSVIP